MNLEDWKKYKEEGPPLLWKLKQFYKIIGQNIHVPWGVQMSAFPEECRKFNPNIDISDDYTRPRIHLCGQSDSSRALPARFLPTHPHEALQGHHPNPESRLAQVTAGRKAHASPPKSDTAR